VLTGPLVTHWTGQFGIAPIDVAATRLADWICCVARIPAAEMPAALPKLVAFGSGAMMMGPAPVVGGPLGHAQAHAVEAVGATEFLGRALDALFSGRPAPHSAAAGADVYSLGSNLHLALPQRDAGRPAQSGVERVIAHEIQRAPGLSARAAVEMAEALWRDVPAASLSFQGDEAAVEAGLKALEARNVTSVLDLATLAADDAADIVRPALLDQNLVADEAAADKLAAVMHARTVGAVRGTAAAIVGEAAKRAEDDPFVRADLAAVETTRAIRAAANSVLKKGLTASTVNALAERIAKRS
jgi:hypothetical protein